MGEFFYPSPFCLVQSLLQSVHYDLVHGFDLPISLRIGRVEFRLMIPNSRQYSLKFLLSNYRPLSEMSVRRVPKRVMMFFQMNF